MHPAAQSLDWLPRMRIALFTECYHPVVNGVVVSVDTFARELDRLGHEVHIYAPAYPGYLDAEPYVHRLPSLSPSRTGYPLAFPISSRHLRRALHAHRPDLVHANHPFLTGLLARRAARRLEAPLVFTYHTLVRAYAHYLPLPRGLVRRLAVWWSRAYCNSSDCVIVPTSATAEVLRSYGVTQRIEVIPTGIDLDLIRSRPRRPVRARYGIPEGVPVVCCSGRVAREKSVDVLIRAFARVQGDCSEAHLLLVGGGPAEGMCRDMAAALDLADRVHVTGYVDREIVFDCLADSDLFAFASVTDTQGLVVLEAMALGCPAVAVRSGAVLDVIHDGEDGLLVSPCEDSLAAGLGSLLASEDLRRRLAGKAQRRAEDFSAGNMTVRLSQVYSSLLTGR